MFDVGDFVRVVYGGLLFWDGIFVDGEVEFIELSFMGELRLI